jgi:hypothetical protein
MTALRLQGLAFSLAAVLVSVVALLFERIEAQPNLIVLAMLIITLGALPQVQSACLSV